MNSFKLFLFCLYLMLLSCAAPKKVYRTISPPAAYLEIEELPKVPLPPVSNTQLLNYLFELHDYSIFCGQQIEQIRQWSEKIKQ